MKKLYRRFMSVAILSLLVVITLVLVTLNCVNYAKIYKDSYEIIDEIKPPIDSGVMSVTALVSSYLLIPVNGSSEHISTNIGMSDMKR